MYDDYSIGIQVNAMKINDKCQMANEKNDK